MGQRKWLSGHGKTALKIVLGIAAFSCGMLLLTKNISINQIVTWKYPIQGVDVSHYQGTIDWQKFREQRVEFAFIKATEGSSHTDEHFADNWKQAQEAGITTGAYHFFSFDSPASTQAEHYIQTVGSLSGNMVPVVDVEYYGNKKQDPPDEKEVQKNLRELLALLEQHYGHKPIIYTTYSFYQPYIKEAFDDYPLWIRNVYYPPVDIGREWQFWQYSDRGELEGMTGSESCIDLNVFSGNEEEFACYMITEQE